MRNISPKAPIFESMSMAEDIASRECNLVLARSRFREISALFSEIDLGRKWARSREFNEIVLVSVSFGRKL